MIDITLIIITVILIQYIIICCLKYVVKKYFKDTLIHKALFDDRYTKVGEKCTNLNKLF